MGKLKAAKLSFSTGKGPDLPMHSPNMPEANIEHNKHRKFIQENERARQMLSILKIGFLKALKMEKNLQKAHIGINYEECHG
ncbi:hypothetical protein MFUM_800017 [Methylacidiphilum fumariolicum SolV]|uniref:Uncharacterized protein n=2 Tax=Candidatus Methylacidiphilum fumarolicum TaxID=591154 RepID=I0JZY3_METFB|nr:conserved protein of unknown function [Candidatus Methylacidiphilum fumarolicum]CCG92802.1 hypothetical protein MFUM_800017 [Methylacidiphilum fumariolicum SolV]